MRRNVGAGNNLHEWAFDITFHSLPPRNMSVCASTAERQERYRTGGRENVNETSSTLAVTRPPYATCRFHHTHANYHI